MNQEQLLLIASRVAALHLAATTSVIGMELQDGTIKYIYCIYDSYSNLEVLQEFYQYPRLVMELIRGGDVYMLQKTTDEIRRMGGKMKTIDSLQELMERRKLPYYFLYRGGEWQEVSHEEQPQVLAASSN